MPETMSWIDYMFGVAETNLSIILIGAIRLLDFSLICSFCCAPISSSADNWVDVKGRIAIEQRIVRLSNFCFKQYIHDLRWDNSFLIKKKFIKWAVGMVMPTSLS